MIDDDASKTAGVPCLISNYHRDHTRIPQKTVYVWFTFNVMARLPYEMQGLSCYKSFPSESCVIYF